MLIVAVEAVVEDGAIEEVRDALRTMETETRKEAGCLAYAFSRDISDPNVVRIFERWESTEALAAHFQSPHMATFNQVLGKLQPKSLDIKAYEIDKEVPLPR